MVAVFHDILVVIGIYSLFQFLVTPDTVVAVLTVLGYSLYDTVVVFDRIRDNSQGLGASGRITYSEMVNLSMNQTLARSINTSMVAIVPVLSVLVIGSLFLGATTLQSFGLALVIGLTSGAYSSIFIASPLLALMKEREQRYVTIRQRLEARGDRGPTAHPGDGGGDGRCLGWTGPRFVEGPHLLGGDPARSRWVQGQGRRRRCRSRQGCHRRQESAGRRIDPNRRPGPRRVRPDLPVTGLRPGPARAKARARAKGAEPIGISAPIARASGASVSLSFTPLLCPCRTRTHGRSVKFPTVRTPLPPGTGIKSKVVAERAICDPSNHGRRGVRTGGTHIIAHRTG